MLVLASASPRRRELLTQAGYSFEVRASDISEVRRRGEDPIQFCTRLAREKAQAVYDNQRARDAADDPLMVLGADTIVITGPDGGHEILGKPIDGADAARMLALLSGRTHQVVTGVSIVSRTAVDIAASVTYVSMMTLSEAEIAAYIATGEPFGKAGAYAIQGRAARWVPRIQGCYFNVVGLPLALTASMIEGMRQRLGGRP